MGILEIFPIMWLGLFFYFSYFFISQKSQNCYCIIYMIHSSHGMEAMLEYAKVLINLEFD